MRMHGLYNFFLLSQFSQKVDEDFNPPTTIIQNYKFKCYENNYEIIQSLPKMAWQLPQLLLDISI